MSQQTTAEIAPPSLADLVDHLSRFEGPPDKFLLNLLAVQCHIGMAEAGTIVRTRAPGEPEVLAVYPVPGPEDKSPAWLGVTVENVPAVIKSTETVVAALRSEEEMYDQAARHHLIMIPLRAAEGVRGVAAFVIQNANPATLAAVRERLELTTSLLSLYEMRLTLQGRQFDLERLRRALQVLASINDQHKFRAAAMSLCNEVASVWEADRVTLGFLKGRYVRAVAMSHTEKFTRKMKLVLDIESAMEECFDQDVEIIHPTPPDATFVNRATADLANRHGPNTVVSMPLRQQQEVIGVLTIERAVDKPFNIEQLEALRLVCELCTARLADLYEHDKWVGAKAAGGMRKSIAWVAGTEHTWIKALVLGIFVALVLLITLKGNDYAEGSFVVEAVTERMVPAPFDGYLYDVHVKPGDSVVKDETLLAELDTEDLVDDLRKAESELATLMLQANASAERAESRAQRKIYQAQAEGKQAQIDWIERQIRRAKIYAPITGQVLEGDLERQIGMAVDPTQMLFRIAPLIKLRAEVAIPEDRVADLEAKGRQELDGQLAPVAQPGLFLKFKVERISPVVEVDNNRNIVRVRVELVGDENLNRAMANYWLKPGVEGQARIEVGRIRYIWKWTRGLVNWVRMKLWI